MFRCHVGGKTEARQELVSEVFDVDGKPARVEAIPATVCANCGKAVFSRETTERVRRMVQAREIHPDERVRLYQVRIITGVFAASIWDKTPRNRDILLFPQLLPVACADLQAWSRLRSHTAPRSAGSP